MLDLNVGEKAKVGVPRTLEWALGVKALTLIIVNGVAIFVGIWVRTVFIKVSLKVLDGLSAEKRTDCGNTGNDDCGHHLHSDQVFISICVYG